MVATQTPLPNTVIDFCRLIYNQRCHTIVMLNDTEEDNEVAILHIRQNEISNILILTVYILHFNII